MKRAVIVLISMILVLSLVFMAGCSAEVEKDSITRTVVDMSGKTVELPETIDNYCILYTSASPYCGMLDKDFEHLYAGAAAFVEWTNRIFPDLASHAITIDKRNVTAEQIIESGAQVVFWASSSHTELIETLENFGIACVNVQVSDEMSAIKAATIVAEVFGTDRAKEVADKYCTLREESRNQIAERTAKIPEGEKRSILVLGSPSTLQAFGPNSFECYWAEQINLDYIVPSDDGADTVELTMEEVYELDPDIILFEGGYDLEALLADPAWNSLRAAQNNSIYCNPCGLNVWSKPGTENILQYKWALATFYPEYAGDINIIEEMIAFYGEFYGYKMSEYEANCILSGVLPEW